MAKDAKKMAESTKIKNLSRVKDVPAGTVTFTVMGGKPIVASLAKIPKEVQQHLMVHGLAQKIGDAITSAQAEAKESGADMAGAGNSTAVAEIDKLVRGVWAERTSTGGILVLALSRIMKKTEDEVRAALAKKSEAEIEKYEADSRVKAQIATIRAERAAAKAKGAEGALTL